MSKLLYPIQWFYREFGVAAIHETGRDAYLIISARACRMVAHGAIAVILALFCSAIDFTDYQIGLFMTLTLLGDVFLGGFLTLIADRTGRRLVLVGGSFLMVMSGVLFALFNNFWILLFGAIFGVISATGGDFGPFRSIEESMLSQLTIPHTRPSVLSWYVTCSSIGVALGSEGAGRLISYLQARDGWTLADAYHTLFWGYVAMGLVNVGLTMLLTDACELPRETDVYAEVPQDEDDDEPEHASRPNVKADFDLPKRRWYNRLSGRLSQISAPTRKVMYKLWILLALDSVADGMVPWSLTNYYVDERFHPKKSSLGDITSAAFVLAAVSTVFAGPLAQKIGLINTMVFTHVPSSAAVLIFPLAPNLAFAIILLFVRTGLNNMDQAPRSAFIAGVVKPEERTAVMGITSMIRTVAAMAGPTLTGILAGNDQFWIAFVAAGVCRLVYDFGLYVLFINVKLHQHETGPAGSGTIAVPPRLSDEEMTELDDIGHKKGMDTATTRSETPDTLSRLSVSDEGRLAPHTTSAVRRRSPSPLGKYVSIA
ncbi:uncharacterized protein LTR77_009822 [Saxophila tyrrhenica]|uniref:Major facilitator superfamily (MFS) profile domain-containing protein n=1 Tax=Saxophila tyrrhenica TaxID=1690608 RepID=A0AAV9NXE1_9PEZI|nr:hypothetical protein LTR77_009822 [Saxophila tyrrhenica]